KGKDTKKTSEEGSDESGRGSILKKQTCYDRDLGSVEKFINPKVFAKGLFLGVNNCETNPRRKDHECENVRDIELPNPAIDLGRGEDGSLPPQCLSINCGSGVAGNEDKDLGSVGKSD